MTSRLSVMQSNFNPRPSYEERLVVTEPRISICLDFNPRPSYEERRIFYVKNSRANNISIHAPHTRSDSHTFTPSFF